jgi:hypothetical protein
MSNTVANNNEGDIFSEPYSQPNVQSSYHLVAPQDPQRQQSMKLTQTLISANNSVIGDVGDVGDVGDDKSLAENMASDTETQKDITTKTRQRVKVRRRYRC